MSSKKACYTLELKLEKANQFNNPNILKKKKIPKRRRAQIGWLETDSSPAEEREKREREAGCVLRKRSRGRGGLLTFVLREKPKTRRGGEEQERSKDGERERRHCWSGRGDGERRRGMRER